MQMESKFSVCKKHVTYWHSLTVSLLQCVFCIIKAFLSPVTIADKDSPGAALRFRADGKKKEVREWEGEMERGGEMESKNADPCKSLEGHMVYKQG